VNDFERNCLTFAVRYVILISETINIVQLTSKNIIEI